VELSPPRSFRGVFRTDAAARAVYAEAAGIQRIEPRAIAVPVDVEDLLALIDWARSQGSSLIPRGSGSSMAGGAIGPHVVVDLSRWKSIAPTEAGGLVAGSGAICREVDRFAARTGKRFPVDPSSAAFCTIGGMTATNAAGAHTLAFGATRDWVTGIHCVFADGSSKWVHRTPRPLLSLPHVTHPDVRKDSSGYDTSGDLVDLLVGSEGTLAFFTEIELRLTGRPGAEATIMGVFPSLDAATEAAMMATECGVATCELLDKTFLDFVAEASGKPFAVGTEAILLSNVEAESAAGAKSDAERVGKKFGSVGATETRVAIDAAEQDALWELRHAASPTLARLSPHLKSMQFIEDGCVPPPRLPEYVKGIRRALDRQQVRGVIFGHAGDAHVHVNPLVDVRLSDWRERVGALLDEVTDLVAALGGTLSGEHGDGRIRTPLLSRVWPADAIAAFEAVKKSFDPSGLLNPDVKVGGHAGIGEIKYDPSLPPVPVEARRVLDEVERRRAYGDFRLDMLGG